MKLMLRSLCWIEFGRWLRHTVQGNSQTTGHGGWLKLIFKSIRNHVIYIYICIYIPLTLERICLILRSQPSQSIRATRRATVCICFFFFLFLFFKNSDIYSIVPSTPIFTHTNPFLQLYFCC